MSSSLQARPKSSRRDRLVKVAVVAAAVVGVTAFLSQVSLVREGVVTLLGKTGPWATPVICRGLDDEDVKVRQASAEALLELGPVVSPELLCGMNDPDATVRRRAVNAV